MLLLVAFIALLQGCDSDPEGIQVLEYKGPPLTSEMDAGWNWEVTDGAVILTIPGIPPVDIGERLVLIDSGTSLPIFGGYRSTPTTDETTWTMYSGEVSIQSFDLEGEISGTVVGQLWRGPGNYGAKVNSTFWMDVSDSTRHAERIPAARAHAWR